MSLLGIDIGTTGCKAAVYSEDGTCLSQAYREYQSLRPGPGLLELDSVAVFGQIKDVITRVAASAEGDPVKALSISSMGEAMVPVSNDRKILGNSIVASVDSRGAEYIEQLRGKISEEELFRINPNPLGACYSMPKLCWIRDNQPELYNKADRFLLWGDLILYMLGGEAVAGYSLANRTLLFDIRKEDWSDRLLDLTGIQRDKLGRTVPAGTVVGEVSPGMAAELNLPAGAKLVVGGHDQCCNALGAGIYSGGQAVCGIGTFACITPVYDHIPDLEKIPRGFNIEHHVAPGLYVSFLYNQAGSLVRWFRDTFAVADKELLGPGEDIYDKLASEMPSDPSRLLTLPYFEPTGSPGFVTGASGVIVGLKTHTKRGEILKSIMEGVAFYFLESVDVLRELDVDTSEFVATGGGAKSDAWMQINADVFGAPFVRPASTEGGILGAVSLAGVAAGIYGDYPEAAKIFHRKEKVFEPDSERHRIYRENFEQYRKMFPLLREFLSDLDR